MSRDELTRALAERDRLLMVPFDELNWSAIERYLCRTSGFRASTHEVLVAAVHKARTALTKLEMRERTLSKRWLLAHGYRPEDDGDVPPTGDTQA
jgi:hypothetical protein